MIHLIELEELSRAFPTLVRAYQNQRTRSTGNILGFSANGMWQFSLEERERGTEFRNARLEPVQK